MLAALAAVEGPDDMRVVEQLFGKGAVNAKASQVSLFSSWKKCRNKTIRSNSHLFAELEFDNFKKFAEPQTKNELLFSWCTWS